MGRQCEWFLTMVIFYVDNNDDDSLLVVVVYLVWCVVCVCVCVCMSLYVCVSIIVYSCNFIFHSIPPRASRSKCLFCFLTHHHTHTHTHTNTHISLSFHHNASKRLSSCFLLLLFPKITVSLSSPSFCSS